MAVEVTFVARFEHPWDVPDKDDVENALDCIVVEMTEEEV